MKKILSLIVFIFIASILSAQSWQQYLPQNKLENGTITLDDYRAAFQQYADQYNADQYGYYYSKGEKLRVPGWKQFKRWEWQMEFEVDAETGRFPKTDAWTEWKKYQDRFPGASRSAFGDWACLGPNTSPGGYYGIGRINCIAFHPTLSSTFWVGAPTGGIWKTTDNGATWSCYGDDNEIMGVSDIIIPDDYYYTQTIYIATGDRDTWRGRSVGVLKSVDGGSSWQETGLSFNRWDNEYVNRLLKHPDYDNIIYAATSDGLYKTTDGGTTFTKLTSLHFIDMEFKPSDPNTIYGCTKHPSDVYYYQESKIYRSVDGGVTWTEELSVDGAWRTELAVSPDEPDWVYAVVCNSNGSLEGIYQSVDSGATYSKVFDGSLPNQNLLCWVCDASTNGGQGSYDLALAVNPNDASELYLGGVNTWKSSDQGISWNLSSHWAVDCDMGLPIVHADKHNLVFRPGTTDLYECNDGGLYISTDFGVTWSDLSDGLGIGQIYRLSTAQIITQEVLIGCQDVGSKLLSGGTWDIIGGGDGTHNIIKPTSVQVQYGSTSSAEFITRTLNHWEGTNFNIRSNIPDTLPGAWIAPFVLDPNEPNTLFVGLNDLWKSTDQGDNFTLVKDFPDGPVMLGLRVIAIAPSNSLRIVVANKDSIYRTHNGGGSWLNITDHFPLTISDDRLITDIVYKDDDDDTYWVTLNSYDEHGVYMTTDDGTTFTNVSYGLPEVPVKCIIQNTLVSSYAELYCATPAGVFVKPGDQPWLPFNNNLPKVDCNWLDIHYEGANSKLRVGTFGRGAWESDLFSIEAGTPGIWTGLSSSNWWDINNWNYLIEPNSNSDVTIPAGCPNYPYVTNAEIKSLTIDSAATLWIGNGTLTVDGNVSVAGLLAFDNNGVLDISGNITWEASADIYTLNENSTIIVGDDWTFKEGTDIDMESGTVIFTGGLYNSSFYNNSPNNSLANLNVDKLSPRTLTFVASADNLAVNGNLSISANTALIYNSPGTLHLAGELQNSGNFQFNNGKLIYSGPESTVGGNSDCYFNDLDINGNSLTNLALDINTAIHGDLHIINGTLDPLSHVLRVEGDWDNDEGAEGFTKGTSNVIFQGASAQDISGYTDFYTFTIDNDAPGVAIQSSTIECDRYDWISGSLTVGNNSSFIAHDLLDQGISGGFNVSGTGSVELHSSTFVNLKGNVSITGGNFDVYGGVVASSWPGNTNASLTMSAGEFNFHDQGIYIHDNTPQTFTENITGGTIRTTGNFTVETPEFSPTGGTVEMYGTSAASITVDPGIPLYNLKINKGATDGQAFDLSDSVRKEEEMDCAHTRTGRKKIPQPSPGNRSGSVTVASDLDIIGVLNIESGEFDIGEYTVDVGSITNISGTLVMTHTEGELIANNDIYWEPGSDANVTAGNIFFKADWIFDDGTAAQLTGNTVTANGTVDQTLSCNDDNACLADFINDNTNAVVNVFSLNDAFRVSGIMILMDNTELVVDDSLKVGLYLLAMDLATVNVVEGGTLLCEFGMILDGTLDVTGGEARVMQDFVFNSPGGLIINGGNFYIDLPYSTTLINFSGTTNIQSGILQVTNDGILFPSGSVFISTGGILKVGYVLRAEFPGTFQPAGGLVEMIGGNNGQIRLSNGNYLHDLVMNKVPSTSNCNAGDSIVVNGDLTMTSGALYMLNQYLIVAGDLVIEPAGLISPGASGNLEIAGNWTNDRGEDGFLETGSTVRFTGNTPANIANSETFHNVTFDKTLSPGQYITLSPGETLTSLGDLQILAGPLKLQQDCHLDANNIEIANGAGLIAEAGQPGIMIDVDGNWDNANDGYTSATGFNHQQCSVTFSGTQDQTMTSANGEEFYKLFIDKANGRFLPISKIYVLDSLGFTHGTWDIGTANLNHYIYGDLEIQVATQWKDSTCYLNFVGEGEQLFRNERVFGVTLWRLVVDQTLGDPATKVIMQGDVRCRDWAYVIDGVLEVDGGDLSADTRIQIMPNGKLIGQPGSTLKLANGKNLYVAGGVLSMNGTEADPCYITHYQSGNYNFIVYSSGYFEAYRTIVEYTGTNGVYFQNGGVADTNTGFQFCTFRNGLTGGSLFRFNTDQEAEFHNVNFPDSPVSGNYNVHKDNDAGYISFDPAFGPFSGEDYENDPYDRVDWYLGGEWTGLVSTDWHTAGNWVFDLIPASNTDVLIPGGSPNNPTIINGDPYVNSLFIESDAILTLAGSHDMVVNGNADIWGTLAFTNNEYFTVFGDMSFRPGSNVNAGSICKLRIYGDMLIEEGSDLNITGGYLEFRGSNPSHLICHQDSAALFQLWIQKSSGVPFYFDASSTGDLFINSFLTNQTGNVIYGDAPTKVYLNRSYNNFGGNLFCDQTHFVFNGNAGISPLKMSPGDYFNDVTVESTSHLDVDNTYSDTVHIKGNLTFNPGISGSSGIDAHGSRFIIEGNWDNNAGVSAFVHGDNAVEFLNSTETLYVTGNNVFYGLIDNTSGTASLVVSDVNDIDRQLLVGHKVTLEEENYIYDVLTLNEPTAELILSPGSYTEAYRFSQGGTLTCNSGDIYLGDITDNYLKGTYVINGGSIELQQDASHSLDLGADITMNGGDFHIYGGNGISKWPVQVNGTNPTITMSGGLLFFAQQGIEIENKAGDYMLAEDISGGTIKTNYSFYCRGADTYFIPSGGIVELTGNTNTDCEMSGANTAFWILKINKTGGAAVKNVVETNIQEELIIHSGIFAEQGYPVNIGP